MEASYKTHDSMPHFFSRKISLSAAIVKLFEDLYQVPRLVLIILVDGNIYIPAFFV
uniref:Uncharacterized protein n=1 Tax=Brugia malayi TaxID=6279 RepID=A8Q0B0_BRUMA